MKSRTDNPAASDLERIEAHYSELATIHGDGPQAAQWSDRPTQEARFAPLVEVGDLRAAKVLDFGCGPGHLLTYLRDELGFAGEYVGYDLAESALSVARAKFPDIRFERREILSQGIPERFDYVLASGVFNNRVDDNWGLMTSILDVLHSSADAAIAFNAMSTYVDFMAPDLWYVDPRLVLDHCKVHLSPAVTIRHDYQVKPGVLPFEFTTYVRRVDAPCTPARHE
jgi:SAM-dependent methyltransferase